MSGLRETDDSAVNADRRGCGGAPAAVLWCSSLTAATTSHADATSNSATIGTQNDVLCPTQSYSCALPCSQVSAEWPARGRVCTGGCELFPHDAAPAPAPAPPPAAAAALPLAPPVPLRDPSPPRRVAPVPPPPVSWRQCLRRCAQTPRELDVEVAGQNTRRSTWLNNMINTNSCGYCGAQMRDTNGLNQHLKNVRRHDVFFCCGRLFPSLRSLEQHWESNHAR
mmetsp:Transcript_4093/g.10548  ORF Transcript_4093/g.10548 Transcript_4093/m.10548 type:complete len:224 (-) Transcript_4093:2460-3131(-)